MTSLWPRALLTIGALLPYWRLLTFSVLFVPDDHFTSDIFNGELPGRVIVGQLIRSGHWPVWTGQICSGYPIGGAASDPLGLALFTLLPPAAALDALIVVILLAAAHGTYSLARRLGADQPGAVLAGLAFAGSGYTATQLKHLSIMSTVAWLPFALVLIDRILDPVERRRWLLIPLLGLLFANQVLAGFPQSAYICGLLYGCFALYRAVSRRVELGGGRRVVATLAAMTAAMVLGAAAGAIILLPLSELTALTDRVAPLDFRWATYTNFWPPNVFTFFAPYINGDASNGTYGGPMPFSENYGYVGAATAVLAIYGAARERRKGPVAFLILMTILSFAFILGPRTPIYYAAFVLVPGMNSFRAPTRFMVLVDLGLALLAAFGLSRLRLDLNRKWIGAAVCVITAVDLFVHQPRQNPMVPAGDWLVPPRTAGIVLADSPAPRTFTPQYREVHRDVHDRNRGWTNVQPYHQLRDLLEPNIGGGYWGIPSADCYVGLAPRFYVSVWSYHYFQNSLISELAFQEFSTRTLAMKPGFVKLLAAYGVTHVLSPFPGLDPMLTPVSTEPNAYIYRVEGTARARVVRAARVVPTEEYAVMLLRDPSFDPDKEIILMDAPAALRPAAGELPASDGGLMPAGTARITRETPREIVVETLAPQDGFLLLADMYYPGWKADVDGRETPIYRANVSVRGISLPGGQHTVRFTYEPSAFFRGLRISLGAIAVLVLWTVAAAYRAHA